MVELRYSLWRVPMALHAMVTAVEEEKVNKVEQEHLGMWVRSMYEYEYEFEPGEPGEPSKHYEPG